MTILWSNLKAVVQSIYLNQWCWYDKAYDADMESKWKHRARIHWHNLQFFCFDSIPQDHETEYNSFVTICFDSHLVKLSFWKCSCELRLLLLLKRNQCVLWVIRIREKILLYANKMVHIKRPKETHKILSTKFIYGYIFFFSLLDLKLAIDNVNSLYIFM